MADLNDARDPVTGLFNRLYLDDALPREISRARRHGLSIGLAALEVGIGSATGPRREPDDALLWEFGYLLQLNLRAEDIACRAGVRDFVLILPGMPPDMLARRMVQMRSVVEGYFADRKIRYGGQLVIMLAVATFPEDGLTAHALRQALSQALDHARSLAGELPSPPLPVIER
jgi:diguanylate cyclase (GGDEF)-like protein